MCFKNQKKKRESSIQDWRKAKEKEKTPNQRLEESKKKKKNFRSKIKRKKKRNIQKDHWTRQRLNNVQSFQKQERKEKKP